MGRKVFPPAKAKRLVLKVPAKGKQTSMNPEQNQSEIEKFLGDIKSDAPKLDATTSQEEKVENVEKEEQSDEHKEEESPKLNRQQRRAVENAGIRRQLEEETKRRIAAEARAETIAELKSAGEVNKDLHKVLFGTAEETPESRIVTENLQKVLEQTRTSAVDEAFKRFQDQQNEALQEEREAETFIDTQLSDIEESSGIDLTSNSPSARKARSEFLEMVEKFSPKDQDGNITQYADFGSVFEMYQQSRRTPTNPRSREIASRSIAKSGEPNMAKEEEDKNRNWLRSVGLKI